MIVHPRVVAKDAAAAMLRFTRDAPALPALCEVRGTVHGLEVRAAVVGASHQIRCGPTVETLAHHAGGTDLCAVPGPGGHATWRCATGPEVVLDGFVEVRACSGDELAAVLAAAARRERAAPAASLVATFPGGQAVTALHLEPGGWSTLHTYPHGAGHGGTIVVTGTRVRVLAGAQRGQR